ncbi:centrosomal protein of 162 kDa-like [Anopheles nili]|uniref:centrosomal protein of 162 kDa-like n=1 Tax=Anopheles nili TaxID=185578 RepID=UPI00237A46F3|nr:centrosomal protein of 162 kDa-like [Anopheles nili]
MWRNGIGAKTAAKEAKVNSRTVLKHFGEIRMQLLMEINNDSPIGGPGLTVEIDETKISTQQQRRQKEQERCQEEERRHKELAAEKRQTRKSEWSHKDEDETEELAKAVSKDEDVSNDQDVTNDEDEAEAEDYKPEKSQRGVEVPRRQTFDKSTQPSPTHEKPDLWSKDRLLELKITVLEDRLKDTEEHYQSKRLQCDTLSQVHRTLRDSYTTLQEESEMMQFDIRHLTRSADVLRSELQSARCDRDSAIELQKLLQTGLDVSHKDRKKLQDGSKKDLKTIQDLQRQCREMERIMMRKNPDSILALIGRMRCVASKSPTGTPTGTDSTSSTCRVLEQRIAQLEADARKQHAKAQGILPDMQARFNSVQANIIDKEAAKVIESITISAANYEITWKILTDRYSNEYLLKKRYLQAPFGMDVSSTPVKKTVHAKISSRSSPYELSADLLIVDNWIGNLLAHDVHMDKWALM